MVDVGEVEAIGIYSSRCRIDNSIHRADIERLKLEGKSYRRIKEIAEKEWGETFSLDALHNHFATHLIPLILAQSKASRQAKEYAERKLKTSMDYLGKLETNLTILERGVDLLVSKGLDDPHKVKMLTMLLTEIRKTVESIEELRHNLDITTPVEHADNVKTLLTVLKKLNLNEAQLVALQEIMKEMGFVNEEPNKPVNTV